MHNRIHAKSIRKSQKPSRIFTRKALADLVESFISELNESGFGVKKAILFGSYVNGSPTKYSDVDLAVWAEGFEGVSLLDIEKTASILSRHLKLQLHSYHVSDTAETDPFIAEIEKTGRMIYPSKD